MKNLPNLKIHEVRNLNYFPHKCKCGGLCSEENYFATTEHPKTFPDNPICDWWTCPKCGSSFIKKRKQQGVGMNDTEITFLFLFLEANNCLDSYIENLIECLVSTEKSNLYFNIVRNIAAISGAFPWGDQRTCFYYWSMINKRWRIAVRTKGFTWKL